MNILFVGSFGVPLMGTASDVRLAFFANALSEKNDIVILNRYSSKLDHQVSDIKLDYSIIVKEIIPSLKTKRISTILLLLFSIIIEPFVILQMNKQRKIDVIHIYTGHYLDLLLYYFISRLIRAKIVYQYVEYRSQIQRRGLYHKINGKLFDTRGAKLWDGVIPISNFLKEKAIEVNPHLKSIKVTPLCDFSFFDNITGNVNAEDYLLFCGSIGFTETIDLIISAYRQSMISSKYKLLMVLGGNKSDINKFEEQNTDIIVKSRLSYNDLILYYKNASVLLIPLRNTIQDIARFPNKICEYTAASGVILTTNVGEIKNYFVDGVNGIVADDFNVESLKAKMDDIFLGKYNIEKLKENSHETGLKHFSITSYKEDLNHFLVRLVENKNE